MVFLGKQFVIGMFGFDNKIYMQEIAYKRRLDQLNQLIEVQRNNVSKAEGKVIANAQNVAAKANKKVQADPYATPVKPPISTTTTTTTTTSNSATTSKPTTLNPTTTNTTTPNTTPLNTTTYNNKIGNTINTSNPSFILDDPADLNRKKEQEEKEKERLRLLEIEKQKQAQKEKQEQEKEKERIRLLEIQKQKQAQKEKEEEEERRKDFQFFLTSSHKLRDLLQQKAKFIQIEYEKQRIYWQNEQKKYEKTIQDLHDKIEEKDRKIQQMLEKIAELKQHLKAALQKIDEQTKIIADLRSENKAEKQENIEIKLENKNVKADNKVVIAHLDKLLNEKRKDSEKTAREIFEEREKRVIDSLYTKSFSTNIPVQKKTQLLPSDRNELSNKVKLQKTLQQYINHREESNRMIRQLQQTLRMKQSEIDTQKRRISILEQNLKKVNELRDMEKDSNKKQKHIIQQYEIQFQQLNQHNECLSNEIQKYYRLPRFKEKIGCISRVKKIKEESV